MKHKHESTTRLTVFVWTESDLTPLQSIHIQMFDLQIKDQTLGGGDVCSGCLFILRNPN